MIREFSAGGIVFKKGKRQKAKGKSDVLLLLVCQHSQHKGWVFPKGFIGDKIKGESVDKTALREVEEETGVRGKIIEKLKKPVAYFYVWKGEKRFKTVYYFLMEYVSGDIANHDFEMQNIEWLPEDDVINRLTYKSDKEAFKEALELLKN